MITEPGVYEMAADEYHSDPIEGGSLSSSGARRLLPPGCPAHFRYEQLNGQKNRPEFDIGTAAHKLVLGVGPELALVDAKDWTTKKAQQQRDEAYERGAVPLLAARYEHVHAMAEALRRHDLARDLLNPDNGVPEQAIFWQDAETGVWRRALIDWRQTTSIGPPTIVDYKTTTSADPAAIRASVRRYGYHQQAPWYLDAVESIGYPDDTAFKFIFQEKDPPYLITVAELDTTAMRIGHARNRRAIEIYRDCREVDIWPGHSTETEVISLPWWVEREEFA